MKIHISAARPHLFHDIAATQYSIKPLFYLQFLSHTLSFSHTTLTLSCKRWGATLENRRKQTWDVATFRLEWEGTTATAMGGHAVGVGGHIFYKSWGGRWMGGLVGWDEGKGSKVGWLSWKVCSTILVLPFVRVSVWPSSFYARMGWMWYSNMKDRQPFEQVTWK